MLLLQIADIHFRHPECNTPDMDPDRAYRTRLLNDVRNRVQVLGPVGAILVGGDIAFRGIEDEYTAAFAWLKDLATASGCPIERVFVVPGNHDVDRSVITKSFAVQNAQAAISRAPADYRERLLRAQFMNPETGRTLLEPLAAYNEFAKIFSCQVFSPERLYWKQNLELEDGVTLRIHGLTSTILSGINGQNDTRESLYLSPLQTILDPVEDVVNLVMSHHPPDWFKDQDEIEDAVQGRAAIHMFGHKHRQRIVRDRRYVRLAAGAVNPDRVEPGWQPGYNLVDVTVEGRGAERKLVINSHLLAWQTHPEMFRPITDDDAGDVFIHSVSFPSRRLGNAAPLPPPTIADAPTTEAIELPNDSVEASMSDEHTRNLVFRFWKLTTSQRREISLALGLIERSELKLPEPERYGRALLRAGERGLLDALANEVAKKENNNGR
ncbi:3',5'-cyclic AMP phosphodiesterase CpdA [Pseudomonas sp. 478]|uniref:metallophosphoesterase n=1 Tax=unclassified Pseudomonas TaxID=196821 RepID=UPI000DACC4CB|nr:MULTISPECIES: metallophosphoesterase [unclassified Pseudomonas]PZX01988.1 3',5'-cyclic AMP phosphodiesterase CpdA [Pseudomonas sp. 478]TCV52081.1 3',5'-cyclic AMP phosphodiesterase CpdA [Pseudomonas sp. 460]